MGFYTVDGEFSNVTVIEKSKFICYIKGINNEDDAKDFIASIKKLNSLANHNCYAYVADDKGLCMKFSDDGEPQGTAGLPMLEVLKNKKIYKTVAVVTRYFGGIKLGTGGLVRAYGGAVSSCLETSKICNMQEGYFCNLVTDYENYSKVLKVLSVSDVSIKNTDFGDKITIEFAVKTEYLDKIQDQLSDIFKGNPCFNQISKDYFAFGDLCQK